MTKINDFYGAAKAVPFQNRKIALANDFFELQGIGPDRSGPGLDEP